MQHHILCSSRQRFPCFIFETMTAPKPDRAYAITEDEMNACCSCGHYASSGQLLSRDRLINNNKDGRPHLRSNDCLNSGCLPVNLQSGHTGSASIFQIEEKMDFVPLDASFVQIPSSFKITEDFYTLGSPPQKLRQQQPKRSLAFSSTETKEASQDSMNYPNESDFLGGLSCLHKAATSPSDPPSLCVLCVQR